MNSIRLIATDLAFTLLNEYFELLESTKEILSRILESDVVNLIIHYMLLGSKTIQSVFIGQNEMDADYVTAWSNGGATDISNYTMLFKTYNRANGNR